MEKLSDLEITLGLTAYFTVFLNDYFLGDAVLIPPEIEKGSMIKFNNFASEEFFMKKVTGIYESRNPSDESVLITFSTMEAFQEPTLYRDMTK